MEEIKNQIQKQFDINCEKINQQAIKNSNPNKTIYQKALLYIKYRNDLHFIGEEKKDSISINDIFIDFKNKLKTEVENKIDYEIGFKEFVFLTILNEKLQHALEEEFDFLIDFNNQNKLFWRLKNKEKENCKNWMEYVNLNFQEQVNCMMIEKEIKDKIKENISECKKRDFQKR